MDIESESVNQEPQTQEPQTAPEQAPQPTLVDPRRRLRELLSVPERDRSDPQWDEINELEIQLAPGNRALPGNIPGSGNPRPPFLQGQGQGQGQNQKKRPQKGGDNKMGGGGGGGKGRRPRKPQPPQ